MQAVKLLLEQGADPNIPSSTGLFPIQHVLQDSEVEEGDIAGRLIFQLLLKHGANFHVRNKEYGQTALHYAAKCGKVYAIDILIQLGVNVNDKDDNGFSPLLIAAMENNLEIFNKFIKSGANVNSKCKKGETFDYAPIHVAVNNGNLEMVRVLVENEADLNILEYRQRTPLHIAVEKDQLEIVQYLIEQEAEVNALDRDGYSPYDLADENVNCLEHDHAAAKDIIEILESKGAKRSRMNKDEIIAALDRMNIEVGPRDALIFFR